VSQSTELVTNPQRLRELEPKLWALFERDERATPFQSPAWLLSWIECFAPTDSLRALISWQGDLPTMFLPLWLDRSASEPALKLVGVGVGDYQDVLLDPRSPDPLPSLAHQLSGLLTQEKVPVELSDLRPGSPLLALTPWFHHHVQASAICPFLPVEGSFEAYLHARPLGLRRNLRRTQDHLQQMGRVEFRMAEASNIEPFMETFLDLHAARWREKSEANVLADRPARRFHQLAAPGLVAHDLLELLALCLDACPVAMAYVLRRQERFMYLTAFDPAVGQVSLGSTIIAESIARAFRAQAPRIDFLRGSERYKYDFGGRDQSCFRMVLEAAHVTEARSS
jgi:CelD/BcsL family acetyltransferase involved in cellulose biosynthesis